MFSSACVCLFVCLSAGLLNLVSRNSVERWHMGHGENQVSGQSGSVVKPGQWSGQEKKSKKKQEKRV